MEEKQIQGLIELLNFTAVQIQSSKDNEQKELKKSTLRLIEKMKLDLLTKLYSMEEKQIKRFN